MKNLKSSIIVLIFILSIGFGCAGLKESPEVQARIDFARQYEDKFFIRDARFSARGKERKTLEISVISSRGRADMSTTLELLVSDDLKRDAKSLGFEEILVTAYGDSWMEGSVKRTIPLK
jgi:hypothetical protein